MIRTAILTIGLASFGLAQVRVPVAGYVVSQASAQLRPVIGAPGAALIGDPVVFAQENSSIAISPDQQYAILSAAQVAVVLIGPDGLGISTPIQGAANSPDSIGFSAGGSAAALYFVKSNKIQIVTGLPSSPQVTREFTIAGDLVALAVSGDAGRLLTADSNGTVSLLGSDGTSRLVASGNSIVAIQFLPDSSRAIAIDTVQNQVLLLSGLPDSPAVQVLADGRAGVVSPSGVQVTPDGRRALVANSGGNNVLNINLETGDATSIACTCRPAFLQPLLNGAILVSDQDRSNVWMLDPGMSRVLFVPAWVH